MSAHIWLDFRYVLRKLAFLDGTRLPDRSTESLRDSFPGHTSTVVKQRMQSYCSKMRRTLDREKGWKKLLGELVGNGPWSVRELRSLSVVRGQLLLTPHRDVPLIRFS